MVWCWWRKLQIPHWTRKQYYSQLAHTPPQSQWTPLLCMHCYWIQLPPLEKERHRYTYLNFFHNLTINNSLPSLSCILICVLCCPIVTLPTRVISCKSMNTSISADWSSLMCKSMVLLLSTGLKVTLKGCGPDGKVKSISTGTEKDNF